MKIIIAGAGRIGLGIAQSLEAEGHDITVIDRDPATIEAVSNSLDVICMLGSATNPDTLRESGAAEADILMAMTESDEVNMICALAAKRLGAKDIIARVRDPEYLSQTEFLRDAIGLSMLVNPEYECAKEISRILRFPDHRLPHPGGQPAPRSFAARERPALWRKGARLRRRARGGGADPQRRFCPPERRQAQPGGSGQ